MRYTQLTQEQRYQIYALRKMGHNQIAISECIGVHKSTISRELRRNCGKKGYRPQQAHQQALSRRGARHSRIQLADWEVVKEKLKFDWSPEQISHWLREKGIRISHEYIYQYVYADKRAGGELHSHLRCKKKYRKRAGGQDRRGKIPNPVSIEQRPAVVDERTRLGDWEVDLVLGKHHRGVLVTLTERKSRFTLLRKVANKSASLVTKAILELLNGIEHLKTITADNGKEFSLHESISENLGIDFYFAHPYASWERGTNENTNGLIRQYLPKTLDFMTITPQDELFIMDRLNLRPRKCLDYLTPFEVFFQLHLVALRC